MAKPKKQPKKSKLGYYLLLVPVLIVVVIIAMRCINIWREQKALAAAEAAYYAAFGISMPPHYPIHGIDVSNHQDVIAWNKVKAMHVNGIAINFAFMKASEGLIDTDKKYAFNRKNAKANQLVCGAYHFFLATKNGAAQATNFINAAQLSKGDLPPVVDIEQLYGVSPTMMRARLQECLNVLEKQYKTKPIIYTYVDFYEKYLNTYFDAYPLWVAHYYEADKPRTEKNWLFWQHSEQGHINGITVPVDCNVFNGDSLALSFILLK